MRFSKTSNLLQDGIMAEIVPSELEGNRAVIEDVYKCLGISTQLAFPTDTIYWSPQRLS